MSQMTAVRCNKTDELEGLSVERVSIPEAGAGEILIKVEAAGVNFADSLMINGNYQEKPKPPFTPGLELTGTVASVGSRAGGWTIGQPVIAVVDHGAFAEFAVAKAGHVVARPAGMSAAVGAALAVNYGTAHGAFAWKAGLEADDIVLVHGAAGGTGLAAVECAKALGARVIATARGSERAAIAGWHGADVSLDSERDDLISAIKVAADPVGGDGRVDIVFDTVGGSLFDSSLRCLGRSGRILVIGFAGGRVPAPPANIFLVKNADLMGFYWGSYRIFENEKWRQGLEWVVRAWSNNQLHPRIDRSYPLKAAAEALAFLSSRRATGKLIIKPE